MSTMRKILLWASENDFLKEKVPEMFFVKKALKKFMPGEDISDALAAAKNLNEFNIPAVFTHLGENLKDISEAEEVTAHYLSSIDKIYESNMDIEISLKLTQLGLDLSYQKAMENFKKILDKAEKIKNVIWIDMESSRYVDTTLKFYKKIKENYSNAGLCLQAYLYRTKDDLKNLLDINPNIRLVKGAYNEPENIAFKSKNDVDENYLGLAETLLEKVKNNNIRSAFGTHDEILQKKIIKHAEKIGLPKNKVEIQMLYGIKPALQKKLSTEGYKIKVLISYGEFWYPWYMRRLAERPANVIFVLKNIFS